LIRYQTGRLLHAGRMLINGNLVNDCVRAERRTA